MERWDAPPEDLERIEEGGRLDLDRYGGIDRLTSELPGLAWQLARLPVRHRRPVEPLRRAAARSRRSSTRSAAALLGVREGQLTIQYHGGGGVLTGEIGRLFFRRKDYPRQIRAVNLALEAVVPPARRPAPAPSCASGSACTSPTAARRSSWPATRGSG